MFQCSWVERHTNARASKPKTCSSLKWFYYPRRCWLLEWIAGGDSAFLRVIVNVGLALMDYARCQRVNAHAEQWWRTAGQRRLADTSEKLAFDKSMMTHTDITLAEKTESEDDLSECERTKCFWERLMRYFWCAHFDRELSDGRVDAAPPTTSVSSLLPSVISFRTHGFVPEKQVCALLSHKYAQALPSVH